ncbi:MAG: CAAX prenyl protease-related protein [Verrucomicrobiota bacterium]
MNLLKEKLSASPLLPRVVPFAVFVLLTALQGKLGPGSQFWIYVAKTVVGAWMLWAIRDLLPEMRWNFSAEAIIAGVIVFLVWVGLDPSYPKLNQFFGNEPKPGAIWNPFAFYGASSSWAWFFAIARIVGSAIVVPPLEEVFYRSFLYRYIARANFTEVPLNHLDWKAFVVTVAIFGLAHNEWLAGFICAAVYQGLVLWKGRLGDAITAHAITNLLLGLWVVWKGAWNFW